MPRLLLAAAALAALAVLGACGGDEGSQGRQEPRAVRLAITSPADASVTWEARIEVAGRVSPARARVVVAGRRAEVSAGTFRATVPLQEGSNVVDVGAWAPRAAAAWAAVRIVRQTLVAVPDLAGAARDEGVSRLQALGLDPDVVDQDGLLDRLLPGESRVCETRPRAGADVRVGATVDVLVSKGC